MLSYVEFIGGTFNILKDAYYYGDVLYKRNASYYFDSNDLVVALLLTCQMSQLRRFLNDKLFHRIANKFLISKYHEAKLTECGWKLLYRCFVWPIVFHYCYVHLKVFHDGSKVIHEDENRFVQQFPFHVRLVLQLESAYYFQGLLTKFRAGIKNKERLLVTHHILCVIEITIAYLCRYEKLGMFILSLMHVSDLWLDFVLTILYTKNQNGKDLLLFKIALGIGFVVLIIAWFLTRLYWLPLIGLNLIYDGQQFNSELGFRVSVLKVNEIELLFAMIIPLLLVIFSVFWFAMILKVFCSMALRGFQSKIHPHECNGSVNTDKLSDKFDNAKLKNR